MAAADGFMNDPKNRDEVPQDHGGKQAAWRPQSRPKFLRLILEAAKNVLPRRGEVDMAAFNRVIKLMAEVGAIPSPAPAAERIVDLQYLRAAEIQ